MNFSKEKRPDFMQNFRWKSRFFKTTISNISSAGVLTNPGVTFCGALSLGVAKAAVSIGPPMSVPGVSVPLSLWVDGISQFNGIVNIYGAINQYGLRIFWCRLLTPGIKNGLDVKNALNVGNAVTNFNGKVVVAGSVISPVFKGLLIGYATGNKPFDLPHWKKKGKRIRHVCAEGPEAGIYIRGKLDGSNVIELPEYWQGLVDYDTITATLTPYEKKDTSLYVKDVSEDRVLVSGDNHTNIKCFTKCGYQDGLILEIIMKNFMLFMMEKVLMITQEIMRIS